MIMTVLYFKWVAWTAEVCARTLTEAAVQGTEAHGSVITGAATKHP
jgi:hypothetical protein